MKLLLFLLLFPALAQATCAVGTAGATPVAALTITAPTKNTDGSPIALPLTYQLWQGTASGAESLKTIGITATTISATGLTDNSTAYFFIVAVDANGALSAHSGEVCKSFPKGIPGTPSLSIA